MRELLKVEKDWSVIFCLVTAVNYLRAPRLEGLGFSEAIQFQNWAASGDLN